MTREEKIEKVYEFLYNGGKDKATARSWAFEIVNTLDDPVTQQSGDRLDELRMTGHAPAGTHFAGWGAALPPTAQGEQAGNDLSGGWLCPACGAMMYEARLLKGYDKAGADADRPTCALHGPLGQFRHIATDRPPVPTVGAEAEHTPRGQA